MRPWNPVAGCTPVSPGCLNCYAARVALRLATVGGKTAEKCEGTAKRAADGRPVFAGRINTDPDALDLRRRWRKPRRIVVNSMSDLFHEKVPLDFVQPIFHTMNAEAVSLSLVKPDQPFEGLGPPGLSAQRFAFGVQGVLRRTARTTSASSTRHRNSNLSLRGMHGRANPRHSPRLRLWTIRLVSISSNNAGSQLVWVRQSPRMKSPRGQTRGL